FKNRSPTKMSDQEEVCPTPSKRLRLDSDATGAGDAQVEDRDASGDGPRVSTELELGERLRKVMLCTVCLELPHPNENYQCALGHILCEDCATRLLAQAAMKRLTAHCPHCRTPISWNELTKNLAVGQTLWELPKGCPDCEQQMDYKSLPNHLKNECSKRVVKCKYRCLGCTWQDCQEQNAEHEASCKYLSMGSDEILAELQVRDAQELLAARPLRLCYKHLSAQRIFSQDLELSWPQRASNFNTEWKFRVSMMYVFENAWGVRFRLRANSESESDNCLGYSLKLLTAPVAPMRVKYFVTLPAMHVCNIKQLRDVQHQFNEHEFCAAQQRGDFCELQMRCPMAIYRLLAMPCIKMRLWMLLN
ncbi:hypothetical protein KR044_001443, partial [Drosophila immigrans]